MFCQHLAMDFRIFPNLSTLVNVCQRILFHGCCWYNANWPLSTLSTMKCVHIILRRFVSKRGALNTFSHSWLLYVMSSYYDWVRKWKNPDICVLICLDFSAAWKSTASICYCDAITQIYLFGFSTSKYTVVEYSSVAGFPFEISTSTVFTFFDGLSL